MIIFVLGGVKGGKSMFAQCCAKYFSSIQHSPLKYIATMIPYDGEDEKRIARHIADRENWGFSTLEEGLDFDRINDEVSENDTILLDSITAYVQNNMFHPAADKRNEDPLKIALNLKKFVTKPKNVVIVSDYIFSDAISYHESVDLYLKSLAYIHNDIAKYADVVVECAYSNMKFWKGDNKQQFEPILKMHSELNSHLAYFDI